MCVDDFWLPLKLGAPQKHCVFIGGGCLRSLGQLKNLVSSLVFAAFGRKFSGQSRADSTRTLCFHRFVVPARLGAAQKLCVFTGGCCLRGLGRLENFVCLWFLLPSRPWGGSQVFAAFEPWGGSKTLSFHKFLLSLRPRSGSKTLRFHRFWLPLRPGAVQKLCVPRGFCCLRGLGRLKNTVFS